MIKNLSFNSNVLSWVTEQETISKEHQNIKAAIQNDINVLVLFEENQQEVAVLYAHDGSVLAKLISSHELCVMYLQNHPRFGLCAVCSSKEASGMWQDGYYSYDGVDSFAKRTFAR